MPFVAAALLYLTGSCSKIASAQQATQSFTIEQDIGLALFGDPFTTEGAVRSSPDGNYFAVWTERGRLDLNSVEDSLRFYRSQDVENFLKHPDEAQPPSPSPVWVLNRSHKEGPIINNWRWLADSSGVAFLEPTVDGNQRLV